MTLIEQPDLFSSLPEVVVPTEAFSHWDERVDQFIELNPELYRRLVAMTRALVQRGRTRIGMKTLVECLRWNYWMTTNDPTSEFKINNSYTSRMARRIMQENPDLDGVFETRELRS